VIRLRTAVTALVLLASVAATAAQAQMVTQTGASARRGRATVVQTPPIIDGRLDDDVWRSAEVLSDFVQREPVEGNPVSERTEVRILTDGEALYVGAWLYDREAPGDRAEREDPRRHAHQQRLLRVHPRHVPRPAERLRLRHHARGRSSTTRRSSARAKGGGVIHPGRTAMQAGALGGVQPQLGCELDGWRTSQDSLGWYAEFRIPFSTIRYGAGAVQTWGLNIMRGIRRRNEEAFWSRVSRQFSLNRLSQAGTLEELPVPCAAHRDRHARTCSARSTSRLATKPKFRSTGEVGPTRSTASRRASRST
jgi:hypothetical protein